MSESSTRPYLIRALYEWCSDNGFTPYLSVRVDEQTKVPREFVKDGEIVLNISAAATRNLTIDNEAIQFSARFGGVSREVSVPIYAVAGIFGRECGHGMLFLPNGEVTLVQPPPTTPGPQTADGESAAHPPGPPPSGNGRPRLKVVK